MNEDSHCYKMEYCVSQEIILHRTPGADCTGGEHFVIFLLSGLLEFI